MKYNNRYCDLTGQCSCSDVVGIKRGYPKQHSGPLDASTLNQLRLPARPPDPEGIGACGVLECSREFDTVAKTTGRFQRSTFWLENDSGGQAPNALDRDYARLST